MNQRSVRSSAARSPSPRSWAWPPAAARPKATRPGKTYKVGIVQFVDDASLNQIEAAIEAELDAKATELGVTFDYTLYNGQGRRHDAQPDRRRARRQRVWISSSRSRPRP